jgi:hypothetical protein
LNDANYYISPASAEPDSQGSRLARAARVLWVVYFMASTPLALLGLYMCVMFVALSSADHEGNGNAGLWLVPAILLVWILGFALANRCNGGLRCLIPFAANLVPVLLLTVQVFRSDDPAVSHRIYLGSLTLLLVAGAGCALAAALAARRQEGAAASPPES